MWRGEAPTIPVIFFRPLLTIFLKEHFARRLLRLRQEIALRDGLAETTRSALTGRLILRLNDGNPPRYATLFFTFVVPAMFWLPDKLTNFVNWLGLSTETVPIPARRAHNFGTIRHWLSFDCSCYGTHG